MLLALLLAVAAHSADFSVVIDAGSTGTRVYKIAMPDCAAPRIEVLGKGAPLASTEDGTLADLLGSVSQMHPEIKEADIRVIGTGGFRRLDGGTAQSCAEACALKRKGVLAAASTLFPNVKLHVASGEEEGRLSWRSVSVMTADPRAVTVEIGGATVQVAHPAEQGVESRMAAVGVRELLRKVPSCLTPGAEFDACREAVENFLLSDDDAGRLLQSDIGAGTAVGVGGAFGSLAATLPLKPGEDLLGKIEQVKALGRKACPAGEGIEAAYKDQACVQLALETILIERFKIKRIENVSLEVGAALEDNEDLGPSELSQRCALR